MTNGKYFKKLMKQKLIQRSFSIFANLKHALTDFVCPGRLKVQHNNKLQLTLAFIWSRVSGRVSTAFCSVFGLHQLVRETSIFKYCTAQLTVLTTGIKSHRHQTHEGVFSFFSSVSPDG